MNIIFLTMSPTPTLSVRGIYTDLLRQFIIGGHSIFVVYPRERRLGKETEAYVVDGAHFLGVRTMNLRKASVFEKGIGQILAEGQFKRAIRKKWSDERFDMILYSTPPITFTGTVRYLKQCNPQAKTYLLLKDIFPQNAVDIGMMTKTGVKGILYNFFRKKEKSLYLISDYIGCMSPANVEYLLAHNPELKPEKVEVAPNSVDIKFKKCDIVDTKDLELKAYNERSYIRKKYDIPVNVPVFIYGGNLGKPQGIPFLIDCLKANANRPDCFFVIVGFGTEISKLQGWCAKEKPKSVKVMNALPKEEYDMLVRSCDVGLLFLDYRFTIPNYPSRLLSYLENKMPILCATDPNTDMSKHADENGYGYWCESVKPEDFTALIDKMLASDRKAMGEKGYQFLKENYLVEHTYNAIMKHFK